MPELTLPFSQFRKNHWILAAAIFMGIGVLVVTIGRKSSSPKPEESHSPNPFVKITEQLVTNAGFSIIVPQKCEIKKYVSLIGKVDFHPSKVVRLHPKAPGVAVQVLKSVGDNINIGDSLAMVENNVGVQTYALQSPIRGTVINRDISAGQSVSENDELFTIGDTTLLQAKFFAGSRDLAKLQPGQEIMLIADRRKAVAAKISYVSKVLDSATRTAVVLVNFESDILKPGLSISGAAVIGKSDAQLCLPIDLAADQKSNLASIFMQNGENFEAHEIRIDGKDLEHLAVVEGLQADSRIINQPADIIKVRLAKSLDTKQIEDGAHDDHD